MLYKSTRPSATVLVIRRIFSEQHGNRPFIVQNSFPAARTSVSALQTCSPQVHKLHLDEQGHVRPQSPPRSSSIRCTIRPCVTIHDGNKNSTRQKRVSSRALTQCCRIGMAPAQPVVELSAAADEVVHENTLFPVWPGCSLFLSRTLTVHRRTS